MSAWAVGARELAFMATFLQSPARQQDLVGFLQQNLSTVYRRTYQVTAMPRPCA